MIHPSISTPVVGLCWLHNETVNVWTHLIPLVYYVWALWGEWDWKVGME